MNKVMFVKTSDSSVTPVKGTTASVGYDLTAIREHKRFGSSTVLYDTGIRVKPPNGYYLEILPRSSLSKTGYVLSNSVGIIDPDYSDNLLIALTKVDNSLPDLTTPFTKCQLVLRKYEDYLMVETDNITETGRGSFGSTDLK
jgi:dUTP pyrophosphatase